MTARNATRNAVLAYIKADTEPRPRAAILKHMFTKYSVTPAATRQQLHRLCQEGVIEVVYVSYYRVKPGA